MRLAVLLSLQERLCAGRGWIGGDPQGRFGWAGLQGGLGHCTHWCDCTALGVTPLHRCTALRSAMRAVQQDSPLSMCPRGDHLCPVYPSMWKRKFQMGVMREQAGMAILSPHFVKDCLGVPPPLCTGLQSCPHNRSGDLLLWSKKRYCGAPTGQAQCGRTSGFPRRRERLWDVQVAKVAHCSSVCSTVCKLNMLHRKPWPILLSKPRNTLVLTVKLL